MMYLFIIALKKGQLKRDESWTPSIAIGNRSYVESVKSRLGGSTIGRKIRELAGGFELRKPEPVYNAFFEGKNDDIHAKNCFFLERLIINISKLALSDPMPN